jgi:predicted 3-demethylubiquinone-9 3-methyltransferase (glyoxalase superfamily)
MQKITPFLWFDDQAEKAVNLYVSLFKNSNISSMTRYNGESAKVAGRPEGSVMTVAFQLEGQEFVALNGGPVFAFSPAISFVVNCETQEEIDTLWEMLSADKASEQCGWLKDKYGVSWQIVPTILSELLQDKDAAKSERVMKAMLLMKKLDIATLKQAYKGE